MPCIFCLVICFLQASNLSSREAFHRVFFFHSFAACLLTLITLFKHLIIPNSFCSFTIRAHFLFPFRFVFAHFKYCSRCICIHCMYIFFVERFTICLFNELILWRDKGSSRNKMNKLQDYSANALFVRLLSTVLFSTFCCFLLRVCSVVHTHAFLCN